MNKILVNNGIEFEDISKKEVIINSDKIIEVELDNYNKDIDIRILSGITCEFIITGEEFSSNVNIIIEEGSFINIKCFIINGNCSVNVYLKGKESTVDFFYSDLCTKDVKNVFNIYHQASKNSSNLICHGFSKDKSNIIFDVNGYVEKTSEDCSCLQDSKIIDFNDSLSQINPNLFIENYNVEASHAAYIGSFSEKDIFYIMSRGLTRSQTYTLLINSFLIGKMNVNEEIKLKWKNMINLHI